MVDYAIGSAEKAPPVRVQKYSGFRWPLSFANIRPAHQRCAAALKADASAADPPANRKAAELRALEGPFRGRMDVFESIWGSFGVRFCVF